MIRSAGPLALLLCSILMTAQGADVRVEVLETAREAGPFAYAADGRVEGELSAAERARVTERLRALLDYRLRRILGGTPVPAGILETLATDAGHLDTLQRGRPGPVETLLRRLGAETVVFLDYRLTVNPSGGGLYNARTEATLTLYDGTGRGLRFRGPGLETADAPRQLALGAPGAASLVLLQATEDLLDALGEHVGTVETTEPEEVTVAAPEPPAPDTPDTPDRPRTPSDLRGAALANALARQDAPVAVKVFSGAPAEDFADWNLAVALPDLLRAELDEHAGVDGVPRATVRQDGAAYMAAAYVVDGEILEYAYVETGDDPGFSFDFGGGLRVSTGETAARVRLAIRVREAATDRVVANETIAVAKNAQGINIGGDFAGMEVGDDIWRQTPIGSATREAIAQAAEAIVRATRDQLAPSVVVAPEGADWLVLGGRDRGFRPGMIFRAVPPGGTVPGQDAAGHLRIVTVEERTSVAAPVDGAVRAGQWLVP